MSDEQATAAEQPQQQFEIQKIYIKDMSFEAPNTPGAFTQEWQPNVNIQLNTEAKSIGETQFEIVLSVTVTAENQGKTAFLVEVQQAGIFALGGFEEDHLKSMLGSFCPDILFPYAREAVSDLVARGGFPQLILAPVNFEALYQEHMNQQAAQVATETATTH
ncbi:MAG: protein-export chaperone SecB [Gammaproteobacteria bacterium]|nr:protein-export chaperone SecB [Gammaproteobacteria bacterium]